VREPWEVALAQIAGSVWHPLDEFRTGWKELDADSEIIVMCSGEPQPAGRRLSRRHGLPGENLQGGIDAWAARHRSEVGEY